MKPNVLFISHEATRTGAPLFLLTLLRWLKNSDAVDFSILLKNEGELRPEFKKLGETFSFQFPIRYPPSSLIFRLINVLFFEPVCRPLYRRRLKATLKRRKYSLIYSNTVTNGDVLEFLKDLNCRVLTHIHELQYVIDAYGKANTEKILKYTDVYIAASESVRANYLIKYCIQPDKVIRVNDFVVNTPKDVKPTRGLVCRELGLPAAAFIVGLSGTVEWRKGPDLLIQLAFYLKKNNPELPIYFLWVGRFDNSLERIQREYDLDKAGLRGRVIFLGAKENAADYFSSFDIFVLLSREEPFGIVGIECAYLEKPVICFASAGGMSEFVENDAGFIVPYLDIEELARNIIILYQNPELAKKLGKRGREKVLDGYTIDKQGPNILGAINQAASMGKNT
jgi:glycosyltransferase involved in cell wall biosynthesis